MILSHRATCFTCSVLVLKRRHTGFDVGFDDFFNLLQYYFSFILVLCDLLMGSYNSKQVFLVCKIFATTSHFKLFLERIFSNLSSSKKNCFC